ncbi:hypothetical protein [Novosphingobium sp.]|uniref:hypothetical protein n=1 Tax=Novosphingobium sp. TaxID=1874826 RepID=UPI0028AB901E|nr:hypothetical protein [Novosphingobium sp.]
MIQFSASAAVNSPAKAGLSAAGTSPEATESAAVEGFAALLALLGDDGLAGAGGIALPPPETADLSEVGPEVGKVGKQTGKTVPDGGDDAGPGGPATGLGVEDIGGDGSTPASPQPVTVTPLPDPASIGFAIPVAPIAATVPSPVQGTVPAQAGPPPAPPSRTVAIVAGVPLASPASEQIRLAPVTIVAAPISAAAGLPLQPLAADGAPTVQPGANSISASAVNAAPSRVEPTEAKMREHSARFAPPSLGEAPLGKPTLDEPSLRESAPRTRASAILAAAPSEPAEIAFRPGGGDALAGTALAVPSQMSLAAPPTLVVGRPNASPQQPQDFDTLVGRLSEAREAAMPHIVRTAMHHGQFGQVSLEFRHEDGGLAVTMASSAPGFNGSVQAAVAANLAGDQPRDSGQTSTPHQSSHAGLSSNGGAGNGGAGTEQRQQADTRGGAERQASDHSPFRQKQATGNRTSDPAAGDDGRGDIYA